MEYQSRTITQSNRNRLTILPIFPTTITDQRTHLLLANVQDVFLSKNDLTRRYQYKNMPHFPFEINFNQLHYHSNLAEYYQRNYLDLNKRLHIPISILDCNYNRLRYCLSRYADERLRCLRVPIETVQLPDYEYALAMEYFIQFDIDTFYMRSNQMNFFCQEALSTEKYIFQNGYQSFLNPNVTCHTSNVIYVLRCICDTYEYVGETTLTLDHCLTRIRHNMMCYLHEFFIGERNCQQIKSESIPNEQIHLYQHITQCSMALQLFVDQNPDYWRFVPLSLVDVQKRNESYAKFATDTKETEEIQRFIQNLPNPPQDYGFSHQQHHQQIRFYQRKHHEQLPSKSILMYNAVILTILPHNTSSVLREFIQALFITHGETTLNSTGHLVTPDSTKIHFNFFHRNKFLSRGNWCHRLIRRSTK